MSEKWPVIVIRWGNWMLANYRPDKNNEDCRLPHLFRLGQAVSKNGKVKWLCWRKIV